MLDIQLLCDCTYLRGNFTFATFQPWPFAPDVWWGTAFPRDTRLENGTDVFDNRHDMANAKQRCNDVSFLRRPSQAHEATEEFFQSKHPTAVRIQDVKEL